MVSQPSFQISASHQDSALNISVISVRLAPMTEVIARTIAVTLIAMIAFGIAFPETIVTLLARMIVRLRERWRRHLIHKYGSRRANALKLQLTRQLLKHGFTQQQIDAAYPLIREEQIKTLGSHYVEQHWPRTLLDHWLR